MNSNGRVGLEGFSDPKTVNWYRGQDVYGGDELYAHFLKEDLGTMVMPMGHHYSERAGFDARFFGEDGEQNKFRTLLSHVPQYDKHDDADLICDAVNSVASRIAHEGAALFEILSQEVERGFLLYGTTKKNFIKVPFGYLQLIPFDAFPEVHRGRAIFLRAKNVWEISMPAALGGARKYRKILKLLVQLKSGFPSFWTASDPWNSNAPSFNAKVRIEAGKKYRARLASNFGYGFREYESELITEAYSVYRYVTFSWAKAVLREHIISQLNLLAKRLGVAAKIEVVGLVMPAEILNYRDQALSGEVSFVEVLSLIRD